MSDLLNKASLVVIPSGYKEDTVYSVVPSDGSGDLSFTRAGNGTRINSAGLVEDCPWNLLQQSETFDNAAWVKTNSTITANAIAAPNGTLTADKIVQANGTDGIIAQSQSYIAGTAYSLNIYAKKEAFNFLLIGFPSSAFPASNRLGLFNLQTGAVASSSQSGINAQIESVGNDWFRCSISVTATTTTTGNIIVAARSSDSLTSLGNGTSGIYIWGAQLNIGSTAKPYFPTTDRLNVPRLTYQNGGGGCPSLLLEKQSTNLFSYSEQFDNAAWSKGLVSISANTTTSPDGTQNADSIIDNTTNSRHVMEQAITGDLSISRAFSLYAKQNTLRYLYMSVTNAGDTHCYSAIFDLQSGTVSATKVNGSATITASIQSVGNGWYRCTITGTMTSGTATFYPLIGTSDRGGFTGTLINNNAPVYIGSGQSLFIWGAQLEASSYPTSYIPTTSSAATRVADACYKTGISSLIGQTEGTLFADVILPSTNDSGRVLVISGGSNRVGITLSGTTAGFFIVTGGGGVIFSSVAAVTGPNFKMALAYKSGASTLYVNGVSILSTTGAFSFNATVDTIYLGQSELTPGTGQNGQRQSEALLFKNALTTAELISLTTL